MGIEPMTFFLQGKCTTTALRKLTKRGENKHIIYLYPSPKKYPASFPTKFINIMLIPKVNILTENRTHPGNA